jgi:predicted secreted Zn-dependent protease
MCLLYGISGEISAMRRVALLMAFGSYFGLLAGAASAEVRVTEKTGSYVIAGRSGAALLDAMDRRGPKHGFLTRAIAQTRYSISWRIEWGETRKACRVKRLDGDLSITYTYPRIAGRLPRGLSGKWARFLAGVQKHEQMHGRLARQMARAAEKSVARLTVANDPGCRKARLAAKQRMSAVYADYEARQLSFDSKEHRGGGPVEDLIEALIRR